MFWMYFLLCWKMSMMNRFSGIDVSLIPRVKFTRSKDYHEYHIVTAFAGENRNWIFISMQLASMSGCIRSSRQSQFLSFPCVADALLRFTATFETKIIYGHHPFGARKWSLWQKRPFKTTPMPLCTLPPSQPQCPRLVRRTPAVPAPISPPHTFPPWYSGTRSLSPRIYLGFW